MYLLPYKGPLLIQITCLDEEPDALLAQILDVVGHKRDSVAALTPQYLSVLIHAISQILLLASYVKGIPCHLPNVIVVMCVLSVGPGKQKEGWKSVLMATGLLCVMVTGQMHGTLVKLGYSANN